MKNQILAGLMYGVVLLGVFITSACGAPNTTTQNPVEPQNEEPQIDEATKVPTTEPTEVPVPEVEEALVDECVACHRDKDCRWSAA